MHFVFYGNHEVINFYPSFNYTYASYDRKVGGLNERQETKSRTAFYENRNVPVKINIGERIDINGESVLIYDVIYDIENDLYIVHTDKQLSLGVGNMTKDEAWQKLYELEQENKKEGFWKRLFG